MRNLKLIIEYDGKNYCGWQIQKKRKGHPARAKSKSIQEAIEKTLRKILQKKIRVISSGRTDSGVHALGQVANFKTASNIPLNKLHAALNGLLPGDIVIRRIEEAGADFHSCFDAASKIYRYVILNQPHPSALLQERAYFYPYPLDIKLMRQEARTLLGRHDFRLFCASGSSVRTTTRTIKKISVNARHDKQFTASNTLIEIDIEADGFLYNMVRKIAGTLLEIGRGRFKKGHIKKMLRSKDVNLCGPTLPARGLFLVKVNY
jgi:tRNA pseudouridine38-40 synthase